MALRGTLKDFGIADIFQLISHQGKMGTLTVRNRNQHVVIHFIDGNIVRAEPMTRRQRDLLGNMLVRAELITPQDLQDALASQKNTLKRLGDILVEGTSLERDVLNNFARLQTNETLYRLFLWDAGSYEFTAMKVTPDPEEGLDLIRSENILMEGFRQVDEWPSIRKCIAGYNLHFFKIEDLDELIAKEEAHKPETSDDPFGDLDDAFGELSSGGNSNGRLKDIHENEHRIYQLISDDRDVQKIIDLSRLGEFETCKALTNLLTGNIIEVLKDAKHKRPSASATVGGITSKRSVWGRMGFRAVVMAMGLVSLWYAGNNVQQWLHVQSDLSRYIGYLPMDVQRLRASAQLQRLQQMIWVYWAEHGQYPENLKTLVESKLINDNDRTGMWHDEYYFEQQGDSFVLLQPLY